MKRYVILAGTVFPLLSSSCKLFERPALPEIRAPYRAPPPPVDARVVDSALEVLELVESESFAEALDRISELRKRFPGDGSLEALERLLSAWTESRCQAAQALPSRAAPPPFSNSETLPVPPPPQAAPLAPPGSSDDVEDLKKKGILLYSEGKLEAALSYWRQALALDPTDEEVQYAIRRAESILSRQER